MISHLAKAFAALAEAETQLEAARKSALNQPEYLTPTTLQILGVEEKTRSAREAAQDLLRRSQGSDDRG